MAKKRTLFNNPLLSLLAGGMLNAYGELFKRTSRIHFKAHPGVDLLVKERRDAVIYALWHRHTFFVPLLRSFGRRRLSVVLSAHRDAQIVAVAARLRGLEVVQGSSTRGGLKAYLDLRRVLEEGRCVCITPDGPRGPAEQVKGGVIHLALQSGCAIVPVSVCCSRVHRLRSWDRSILPLPFSRGIVYLGKPLRPSGSLEAGQEELLLALRDAAFRAGEC